MRPAEILEYIFNPVPWKPIGQGPMFNVALLMDHNQASSLRPVQDVVCERMMQEIRALNRANGRGVCECQECFQWEMNKR